MDGSGMRDRTGDRSTGAGRRQGRGSADLMHAGRGPTTPCALATSQLVADLDGELGGAESAWVASHLADCPSCREERVALEGVRVAVSSALGRPGASTPAFARVLERLDSGEIDPLSQAEAYERRPSGQRPIPPVGRGRRPGAGGRGLPWAVGAGSVALLSVVLAFVAVPAVRETVGRFHVGSLPAGTATSPMLTLTGHAPSRDAKTPVSARAAHAVRNRETTQESRGALAAADSSRDLQVPEELRRRPGMFLDMNVVRRLDKLKKMEAVYRAPGSVGGAG